MGLHYRLAMNNGHYTSGDPPSNPREDVVEVAEARTRAGSRRREEAVAVTVVKLVVYNSDHGNKVGYS